MLLRNSRLPHTISIHALREEGDLRSLREHLPQRQFLSTPSARRATVRQQPDRLRRYISIHALREEGDSFHDAAAIRAL